MLKVYVTQVMEWLRKPSAWWIERRNEKQQELADMDMWLYGVGFLKIDSTGSKTRIDPLKLYSKFNSMTQTYDNPLAEVLKEKVK